MILVMQNLINQSAFKRWIEDSLASKSNVLARSNQGTILLYQQDGVELIIKSAMGNRLAHSLRQSTLNRERSAYGRMQGLTGVPHCYGMVDGKHLILEYIRGVPYREAAWEDRAGWFAALLKIVQGFHARGVSHGDLKSKGNIIVTDQQQPCVVDFGTAILFEDGLHPINNRLFSYGSKLDLNAWVKHKYHGSYRQASEEDRKLLNYSWLERTVRRLRGRPMR